MRATSKQFCKWATFWLGTNTNSLPGGSLRISLGVQLQEFLKKLISRKHFFSVVKWTKSQLSPNTRGWMTRMTNQNLLATELAESIISLRHTFKQVAQLCWKCKSLSQSSIISQVVMENCTGGASPALTLSTAGPELWSRLKKESRMDCQDFSWWIVWWSSDGSSGAFIKTKKSLSVYWWAYFLVFFSANLESYYQFHHEKSFIIFFGQLYFNCRYHKARSFNFSSV